MRVENLVPWAGEDFSYIVGQEIEIPDDVAKARMLAGLCKPARTREKGEGAKNG